jgi:hypothetical protein
LERIQGKEDNKKEYQEYAVFTMIQNCKNVMLVLSHYIWKNEMTMQPQKAAFLFMERNQSKTVHCWVFNVNLCPNSVKE